MNKYSLTLFSFLSLSTCLSCMAASNDSNKFYAQSLPPLIVPSTNTSKTDLDAYLSPTPVLSGGTSKTFVVPANNFAKDVVTRFSLQRAEIFKVTNTTIKRDNTQFYCIAIPMNVFGNLSKVTLAVQMLLPFDGIKIESIYPSHQYLATQYEHTGEFGVSVEPQFMPFGGAKAYYTDTRKTSYQFLSPLMFGTVDESHNRIVWNLLKQGKQRIDQGTLTNFVVISVPYAAAPECGQPAVTRKSQISIAGFEFGPSNKLLGWGVSKVDFEQAINIDVYKELHSVELPAASISLVNSLCAKPSPETGGQSFNVKINPVGK